MISDTDYKDIVEEVLEYRKQLSPDYSRPLEESIRKVVRVKGFHRNPLKAPSALLIPAILESSSDSLVSSICSAWLELYDGLREKAFVFLNSYTLSEATVVAEQEEVTAQIWSSEETFNKAVKEFQNQHPDLERKNAEIMLCLLKYCKEVPILDKPLNKEETPTVLNQVLRDLQDIPVDSPEWEPKIFGEFVKKIEELREKKYQEREAPHEQLRLALSDLMKEKDALSFFEFSSVYSWKAEACSSSEAKALKEEVDALRGLLVEHQALFLQSSPTKISEKEARDEELGKKEHRIKDTYGHLENSFATPQTDSEQPESEPPTEEKESRELADVLNPSVVLSPENDIEEAQDNSPQPDTKKETFKKHVPETGLRESSLSPGDYNEDRDALGNLDAEFPQELLPATEVAKLLKENDCAQLWHKFLWALVAEDDLPSAYWLAKSLAESDKYSSPVPEGLLAAVQAARWLLHDKHQFIDDMRSIIEKTEIEKTDNPVYMETQMLMLSASLNSAVIAPHSGMISWLVAPPGCSELAELVNAVKEFANLGIILQPEDLKGVAQEEIREIRIKEIADSAGNWLKEAQKQRIKYKPAYDTWRALVAKDGELEKLIIPVAEDRRDDMEKVKEMIDNDWSDSSISTQIQYVHQKIVRRQLKPIQGKVYKHLLNRIKVARDLASDWCYQIDGLRKIQSRDAQWHFNQVDHLRNGVQKTLSQTEAALEEMSGPAQHASLAAAAFCLRRTVRQFGETLNLETSTTSLHVNRYRWFTHDAENLHIALSRRLLWFPELSLSDDGQPAEKKRIAQLLCTACVEERSLNASFEAWLKKQDYRFVERILSSFGEETNTEESSHRYREEFAGSQAALHERMNQINEQIEQALVDGIIGEERSEYNMRVIEIELEETRNFPEKFDILDEIDSDLSKARTGRSKELNARWRAKKKQLEDSHLKTEKKKEISDVISEALKKEDTRLAEEAISSLNRILDGNADPEEILFRREEPVDALVEFVEKAPRIADWLGNKSVKSIIPSIQGGRQVSIDGISFTGIPKPRRDEAVKAIEQWHGLKQKRPAGRDNLLPPLKVLLEYLGFEDAALYHQADGADWLHANANMSANDSLIRPIPQFGSQAHGHYNIICLWERPGAESIVARLRESRLDTGTVIVFYLGRISKGQKRDIARICRERELALAILDEILLVFLALQRDSRLPTFLNCALPLTALNPYTPFKAGDVPPEMFFGRERMVRELQNPVGSCIVYGGRQLGKSALLRHVQRQFHNPEQKKFAWIEDMKLIFDPNSGRYTNNFWRTLQDGFIRAKLLNRKRATKDETIVKHIRQAMQEDNIHVLVMFDEADDFLNADASEDFEVVVKLRNLMTETGRRFKVVFAGLHNVQRFQGIPNQPLAHFGDPLCVGPLEADAARQLVEKPLRTLGYRFDNNNNTTVLRVLSYTNSHPGLIQIFCQELLRRLNKYTRNSLPPHQIEKEDIEAVYRLHKVRECIKERFDWTLALDPRYQAIAWAMIYDQIEKGDSYSAAYTSSSILQLAREWWKKEFGDMKYYEIQSLLGDLCGLGVLVRNAEGEYHLRSPNLVRLMGTGEDIGNRLLDLSEKELPRPFEADNRHTLINTEKRNYSPLSYAQERNLMVQRFGVGLVCASEAMGFSMLNDAFKKCADFDEGIYAEVPANITDGNKLKRWLKNHLDETGRENYKCLVVCCSPPPSVLSNLDDLVKSSLDFCGVRLRTAEQWLRILFLFDSTATMRWLFSPRVKRMQLEDRADAVVFPTHWNLDEIHCRLDQNEKISTEDIRESILRETGGWPILLDKLFHLCRDDGDVKPAIETLKTDLQDPSSEISMKFRKSLGLEANPLAYDIWNFLSQEANPVPADLIIPMIRTEQELTIENCENAIEYLHRTGCITMFEDGTAIGVEPTLKRLIPSL